MKVVGDRVLGLILYGEDRNKWIIMIERVVIIKMYIWRILGYILFKLLEYLGVLYFLVFLVGVMVSGRL